MSRPIARASIAVATAFALCFAVTSLPATAAAAAEERPAPAEAVTVGDGTGADTPTMREYPAEEYLTAAAGLPDELASAIETDLGLTPSEYLAEADAAVDAGDVVGALEATGISPDDAVLNGTELFVLVDGPDQEEAVVAAGATPVTEPIDGMGVDFSDVAFAATADLVGGTGWTYSLGGGSYTLCSVGFNGRATSNGAHQFATAGHCLEGSSNDSTPIYQLVQSKPNTAGLGAQIGTRVPGSVQYGGNVDSARVAVAAGWTPRPTVTTWGGGKGSPTSGTPVTVRGATAGVVGAKLCKSGRTTGWSCGTVQGFQTVQVEGHSVNSVIADVCAIPGDSGGAALIGNYAVGISSGSNSSPTACAAEPLAAFFAMTSTRGQDVLEFNRGWELSVGVQTPKVDLPASGRAYLGSSATGTVPQAPAGTVVSLYLDGSSTPASTATLTKTGGSFALPLTGAGAGAHTWKVIARVGTYSASAPVTGSVTLAPAPKVDRLAGQDRYTTAVAISRSAFPSTAPIAYVASGAGFADALAAAPAAARAGGPLLLTPATKPPAALLDELRRLKPERIVVVGGTGAIAKSTADAFAKIAPVKRLGGADRYATSRKVVDDAFPGTTTALYVASGANFPDALAASAAAGRFDSPVVLTNGRALDAATAALVKRLGPGKIRVAGGSGVVSDAVVGSLKKLANDTKRVAGADRFTTGLAISTDAFTGSSRAFLANGFNFPDALAGAAFAGSTGSPLFLSQQNCLAPGTTAELQRLGVTRVTLLGAEGVLSANVARLREC
ncbi:cell wall-binding repeat-containing protein [Agromyces mediolanus]|uniref:cell wall-binding repeat-containing protein n=1 Tax=Agromyces mediolanus TaxID=41986 RepID=UPI003836EB65